MVEAARVEVVLINYKRPANVQAIVEAFQKQTAPCDIALIDVPAAPEFQLGQEVFDSVDIVYRWNKNFGPYNRYVSLAAYSNEFTYFHDDDMLPGSRLIEHFLEAADSLGEFGVLGQQGRIVDADGTYHPSYVARTEYFVPVDLVVRGYFVRTRNLSAVVQQRHAMSLTPDDQLEDDLLLCTSMSIIHGLSNYLTPLDPDVETKMNKSQLPEDFARHIRGNHIPVRSEFCRRAITAGWAPLGQTASSTKHSEPVAKPSNDPQAEFDVNAYWLKRGTNYIAEERLNTEPYILQEQFILDSIASCSVPTGRILEIGCGYGRITRRLAEAFPDSRITALDLSPVQLQNARAYCADYLDRIEFLEYDIYSWLPFPRADYDIAIAIEVFLHHPYETVHRFLASLSEVAERVINYDWSEKYSGVLAPHVWVHDYEEIYREIGLNCDVFVEPRKFNGQQQKLFIATNNVAKRLAESHQENETPTNGVEDVPGDAGPDPTDDQVVWMSEPFDQPALSSGVQSASGGRMDMPEPSSRATRNRRSLSMADIDAAISPDQSQQATIDDFLKDYPEANSRINIVDLGCGTGRSYEKLKEYFPNLSWVGVDIANSPEVRNRSRSDLTFVTYDGVNLPLKDNSVDLIVCQQVFEHVRHPEPLLEEVVRVLRPEGQFVGSVSQMEPLHTYSLWNYTYYGFATIAHDAGLELRELQPGIDAMTLMIRHVIKFGFHQTHCHLGQFFSSASPLNMFLDMFLRESGKSNSEINRLKMLYSGHFWFKFAKPSMPH